MAFFLIVVLVLVFMCLPVFAVIGTVDASQYSDEVWSAAGYTRWRWVPQAAALLVTPVVLVYSGIYFFRVRRRLVRAQDDLEFQRTYKLAPVASPPVDDEPGQETRSQLRIRQPLWTAFIPLVGLLPIVALHIAKPGPDGLSGGFWVVFVLLIPCIAIGSWWYFGITATESEFVVSNVRRTRIRFGDVVAITQEQWFNTRRMSLWTANGHRIRFSAPSTTTGFGGAARFQRQFDEIGQWWLTHRPPSDEPVMVD